MWSRVKAGLLSTAVAFVFGAAIGFGAAGTIHNVQGQGIADPVTLALHVIYTKDNASVVTITVRIPTSAGSSNGFNAPVEGEFQYAAGSGFVYDTKGDIVTNAHVVDGADQIEITFSDDTMMYGKVVGVDADSDIAVVKAQGDTSNYQPLVLADSDTLQVGDRAIAIGNPFENSGTMTQGIVSGLNRLVQGLGQYSIPDAIQTDAAINPGNSGGPLLDISGNVIGVNEQIASQVRQSSGVSFAIPSNIVKMVADALIRDGSIQHTYLGVSGTSGSFATENGIKVQAFTRL